MLEIGPYSFIDEIHQKNIDWEESHSYMQIYAHTYCSAANMYNFAFINVSPSLVKCCYKWLLVKASMLDLWCGGN